MSPSAPVRSMLLLAVRLVLGGLFVFAAVVKLSNPQGFADAILAFKTGLPKHLAQLATFALPWCELLAGLCLIVGLWARSAAGLIAVMLVAFLGGIVSVMVRGLDVECGCFGKFEIPCTGGVGVCHLVRNVVLLAMAVAIAWRGAGRMALDNRLGAGVGVV